MKIKYEGPEYPVRIIALEILSLRFQVERWRYYEKKYVIKLMRHDIIKPQYKRRVVTFIFEYHF